MMARPGQRGHHLARRPKQAWIGDGPGGAAARRRIVPVACAVAVAIDLVEAQEGLGGTDPGFELPLHPDEPREFAGNILG